VSGRFTTYVDTAQMDPAPALDARPADAVVIGAGQAGLAVALVEERVRAGLPPRSVVGVTGLARTGVVRTALEKGALERQEMFSRLTPDGASWADGRHERLDAIVWATGFRSALGHLTPLRLREPGGGIRVDGTRVLREPRLQLVGYGPSASTIGANRAGRAAALAVRELLAGKR
jgi:cation diffusion facilitator CzcD-associated flavoprotein CzcO